jgi:hypothetical protein
LEQPRKRLFTAIVIASAVLIFILTIISPSLIRMALSLSLILFLPGYGITSILFSGRGLDIPARLLLSVALSLAITALSGLLLHLTPWGIALDNPGTVLLLCGTGLVGLIFLVRNLLNLDRTTVLPRVGFQPRQILLLVLAGMIAVIAVNLARTPVASRDLTGYTLLWVQPPSVADRLELGVRSEEFRTRKYQLRFEINQVLREGPTFELKPGETLEYVLKLGNESLAGQPIKVLLYRLDRPDEVYRRVVWWNEDD